MFYICRFSENWLLYDTMTQKSRPLTTEEAALLSQLFGHMFLDTSKILSAVKVESISPNKLLSLPIVTK
jgi:hypothetical protein